MTEPGRVSLAVPIGAGVVTALVGFTSSFAVVLTGLRSVGASEAQAASGLFAMSLVMALGITGLALRYRIPITLAWSTPGAALLAGTGAVVGGWPAAVGAFVTVGLAIVLTGVWSGLGRVIASIPVPLAQAMLAGVILPLCVEPVRALADNPAAVAPVVLTWIVFLRLSPRWAVPAAFAVAAVVIGISLITNGSAVDARSLLPSLDLVAPTWTWQALVGIALPLYIVTMASQNIPGTAVMASFGYTVPWRAAMTVTGLGTAVTAPAGVHAVNLAAISAALAAAPDAHPDKDRRWIAAVSAGASYLVLAVASAALATLVAMAPAGIVETVAGLALLATLAASLAAALGDEAERLPAAITFVVAASGVGIAGIGSAFWALVLGLVVRIGLARTPMSIRGSRPTPPSTPPVR
ncbi:benzoate/H(+) symporter BenE family transporter [Rhodococcus sp. MEB064]|uniref:benzoate/H(+) symporter BenE family transporter n=1 Tax=Rhodococcus sp. MEB064 TaxID=1587522 RepID=UPI0005ABE6B1|nr:benzoate/H(+) symporter BenE family transporter [Rhodococcus sp. MEB064]